MDVKEMMAKRARQAARYARGERTIEDVLGSDDDFCLMRIAGTSTFACFDCDIVEADTGRVSDQVTLLELTDDQVEKVRAVLDGCRQWNCVHVLDGTIEELQREVDDYAAMVELESLLAAEQQTELRHMVAAAHGAAAVSGVDYERRLADEQHREEMIEAEAQARSSPRRKLVHTRRVQ
jgi:hypothetical protein